MVSGSAETKDEDVVFGGAPAPIPGLLVVFEAGKPTLRTAALTTVPLRVGRDAQSDLRLDDELTSKTHAEIALADEGVAIRDLESRNGTFVDGERVGQIETWVPRTIRIGSTVLVFSEDIAPWKDRRVRVHEGIVIGPATHRAYVALAAAARAGRTCLITGESGAGKENAARHFHASSPHASGPFVAVNCATIARELAESELFGAKKGAFSGALADRIGYFEAAARGVLFLDEIGTLDLALQAKLLRAVETKEITPVGATSPRRVDVTICAATNEDLDHGCERGAFRLDLLQRLRQAEVALSPLRDRPDELPYIAELAAEKANAKVSAPLVEECLLRAWRGTNARGLVHAVEAAASVALAAGHELIAPLDLPPRRPPDAWEVPNEDATRGPRAILSAKERKLAALAAAYRECGDVDQAAKRAGIGRTTAYAALKRLNLR